MDVCRALADVASFGAFFAVSTDPAEGVDPTWRPLRGLYTDPQPLRDRIAHVGRVLGAGERVAASITFQGLAARVLSAPFATVAVHGVLPDLTAAALHWRPSATGPWPLWCADPGSRDPDELAALLIDDHLAPLVDAVRAQVSISERVLWGSVASSVASGKRLVGTPRATAVAEQLLATGPLAGTGELRPPAGPDRDWTFRRRSCCLYYRVPGGGLCGDCVLAARP
ncbi:(2Fe-2S)-binding protein [Pseudonocardia sp. 73-21]|uniref:(2Fe-2S)-binding protein n=1 Tax=Pseudonocardia sp. 73-21 TaxID=1895809 RepID=UPI00095B72E5|nr:(2Fe-2S)-binding protein [Pseudonocardia sp. 73-21]OJY49623.1 MAG: hypothetical protein BGP03_18410 [Pseudonocardia sp. 73-21]